MNRKIVLAVVFFLTSGVFSEVTDQRVFEELSKEIVQGRTIELNSLEIKAKIHEPSMIYILDRPNATVQFDTESPNFVDRIRKSIVDQKIQIQ